MTTFGGLAGYVVDWPETTLLHHNVATYVLVTSTAGSRSINHLLSL